MGLKSFVILAFKYHQIYFIFNPIISFIEIIFSEFQTYLHVHMLVFFYSLPLHSILYLVLPVNKEYHSNILINGFGIKICLYLIEKFI